MGADMGDLASALGLYTQQQNQALQTQAQNQGVLGAYYGSGLLSYGTTAATGIGSGTITIQPSYRVVGYAPVKKDERSADEQWLDRRVEEICVQL